MPRKRHRIYEKQFDGKNLSDINRKQNIWKKVSYSWFNHNKYTNDENPEYDNIIICDNK